MDPFLKTRVEIETLHELLDELDYYAIMLLKPESPQSDVDPAFREVSRKMHPDRLARLDDAALKAKANDIYRLANEAYRCLKDPDQRGGYDLERAKGALRMSADGRSDAARDAAAQANPEAAAKTQAGEKYWKMALKCWRDGDPKGCVLQIRFAIQFEPDNAVFKEWLDKALAAQEEEDESKEKNPYKLRIV